MPKGKPLAGDRAVWDADGYPLLHTNDSDAAADALHHTLGTGANQAAAGNHTHTSSQVGLSNVANILCKFDATSAPTANDDSGDGYAVGSSWFDVTNDKAYLCLDATVGAALWQEVGGGGGGGGGGGYSEGTTFPVSPATNDKFYRTDRNMLYYYDGTRWLTTNLFIIAPSVDATTATVTVDIGRIPVWTENGGMYLVSVKLAVYVTTTNNGSNYWTAKLVRAASNNNQNDVITANTSADSASTWYEKNLTINAVLDSTARAMKFRLEPTGSPGTITFASTLIFRLIG